MKQKVVAALVALTICAVPALADFSVGSVMVDRVDGYFSGSGGEFTLTFSSASSLLSTGGYSAAPTQTKNVYVNPGTGAMYDPYGSTAQYWDGPTPDRSFQTFCLETNEYVSPPHLVEQVILNTSGITGSQAVKGGTLLYGGPNPDPLDPMTAYLYTKFATGTLTGYTYVGAGRAADAGELQNAIWFIEQEIGGMLSGKALQWYNEASTAVSSGAWVGIGNVRVLNLYDNTLVTARQDMLYLVPVPGAALLGFLGLGWAGMKLRKVA